LKLFFGKGFEPKVHLPFRDLFEIIFSKLEVSLGRFTLKNLEEILRIS